MAVVRHTASFEIRQPAKELFPLFTPEGEKLWASGWDYEVTCEYIGLSPAGDEFVAGFSSAEYAAFIAAWEALLARHFETRR